jgi:hypothetical protein
MIIVVVLTPNNHSSPNMSDHGLQTVSDNESNESATADGWQINDEEDDTFSEFMQEEVVHIDIMQDEDNEIMEDVPQEGASIDEIDEDDLLNQHPTQETSVANINDLKFQSRATGIYPCYVPIACRLSGN